MGVRGWLVGVALTIKAQADAALNELESTLQGHTDQLLDKSKQRFILFSILKSMYWFWFYITLCCVRAIPYSGTIIGACHSTRRGDPGLAQKRFRRHRPVIYSAPDPQAIRRSWDRGWPQVSSFAQRYGSIAFIRRVPLLLVIGMYRLCFIYSQNLRSTSWIRIRIRGSLNWLWLRPPRRGYPQGTFFSVDPLPIRTFQSNTTNNSWDYVQLGSKSRPHAPPLIISTSPDRLNEYIRM